jgi:hypothetical protein
LHKIRTKKRPKNGQGPAREKLEKTGVLATLFLVVPNETILAVITLSPWKVDSGFDRFVSRSLGDTALRRADDQWRRESGHQARLNDL